MGRTIGNLTALSVQRASVAGLYSDRGPDAARGLYLQITTGKDGTPQKSWVFRYSLNGRAREMGLGSLRAVTLAEAREQARAQYRLKIQGIDPIEARKTRTAQQALEQAKAVTFGECADAYVKAHHAGWRNAKHAYQWEATLAQFAAPVIGALSVQAVDTSLVLKVLEPIWTTKTETAGRLRGRIEMVLDWATVRGFRTGDNPARWRGHLDKLLPAPSKVRKVEHHAALPYAEVGAFMTDLRQREGVAARALEFAVLNAARAGEVLGAAGKSTWAPVSGRLRAIG